MADQKSDIERYHRGEMTPAEMHALEKRALSDPFLAEALEGAEAIGINDLSEDLNELRRNLNDRQAVKKTVFLSPVRIAASLLFLMAGSFILYTYLKSPAPVTLAEQQARPDTLAKPAEKPAPKNLLSLNKPSPAPARKSLEKQDLHQAGKAAGPATEKNADEISPQATQSLAPAIQSPALATPSPASKEKEPVASSKAEESEIAPTEKLKNVMDRRARASAGAGKKSLNYSIPTFITGTVTSEVDQSPLPGVNVTIKGTETGTVTDSKGNYKIALDDAQQELVFSAIGFAAADQKPAGRSKVDVALPADSKSLSEVVVTGYGLAQADEADKNLTVQLAEPVGGREAFNQYLRQNLKYPAEALKQKTEGKVTIEFTVQRDGMLSGFTTVHGIGAGCDEELIRLVREGPAWTPNKLSDTPRDSKVRVSFKFSLPK